MLAELSRGIAVLKGVWSVDSTVEADEGVNLAQMDFVVHFLSQAEKQLATGRHQSAAILAGDALEDTLRRLCAINCVIVSSKASSETMNAELASRGVYGDDMQQRLHRAASLSEKANCGLWSDFSKDDVALMLAEVRAFAAEHAAI